MQMNLRTKLLSMIVPFVLVIVLALVAVERMGKSFISEQADAANLTAKKVLWDKIVSSRIESMSSGLFAVTRNQESLNAIVAGDGERLGAALLPTYNRLSATKVITKLQITDKDGRILYNSGGDAGAVTSMVLVKQALKQGKMIEGIQRDDEGKLSAAYVFPLYIKTGRPIGTGIFIASLDGAIADFKSSDGADLFITSDDGSLEYASDQELWRSLKGSVAGLKSMDLKFIKAGGVVHHVGKLPIALKGSNASSYLLTVKDETRLYNTIRNNDYVEISVILVLMVAMAIGIFFFLRRALRPISKVVQVLNNVAQGDMRNEIRITGSGKDEIGQILTALKNMQERLSVTIKQTADTANALTSSSHFMSDLAVKTTNAVSRQQSESDQVVTAMNEMTSTVMEVAHNAGSAAESAREADDEANKGKQVVNKSINVIQTLAAEVERGAQAIHELESESTNIGAVLDVIRDIADQTNLLALNAAIEAARAGEQGRGFAVVADEVRTLASRTAESTAEIQQMIENLQSGARNAVDVMESGRNQAQHSVEQATEAGRALETIASMVAAITDMNVQIASAAEEQTAVADEINRNVVNINEATSAIAEGANEAEAAGDHLVALSNGLNDLVSQFKIK
jgi:methyl-accepting chemotaxis protein